RKRTMKGNKEQISLTISVELVDRLDAMAAKVGQTRAGVAGAGETAPSGAALMKASAFGVGFCVLGVGLVI
ncbi:hypothetical protein, partial [Aeromonas caviae]|uniref:hypothetical protein n=1 Tax=Aeromonas caviae TaxID=648 RepID=UPI001CC53A46